MAWPALAAGTVPLLLLTGTTRGRLGRGMGTLLVVGYAVWVTAVLAR